jgi:phospholipase/carboxylesterase
MLETVEVSTGADPVGAVIWLHGLGADGHDFESIVPHLGIAADRPLRFVFPHGPRQPVTINGGMVMRAWYDILAMTLQREVDADGIRRSAVLVEALIEREIARGIPASRIVLAGFSQGGAMTLDMGLRYGKTLAGLMVLSAYLPLPDALTAAHAANAQTPIFQGHGTFDMVVPMAGGRMAHQALLGAGYSVQFETYPVAHGVHPSEIRDVGVWLNGLFG